MPLHTVARDCLYVNWAVPATSAPELPAPLRYQVHDWQDSSWIFTTALFFRFVGLHSQSLPWVRISYPQMSLRLHIFDGDDIASVLFARLWVPPWVAPAARLLGSQRVSAGRFGSASGEGGGGGDELKWRLADHGELNLRGRMGLPTQGPGPDFGNWRRMVDYVSRRSRGYVLSDGGVRSVRRRQPPTDAVPMAIDVERADLLDTTFAGVEAAAWVQPHSAWFCSEIPVTFELGEWKILPLPSRRRRMAAAVPDGC